MRVNPKQSQTEKASERRTPRGVAEYRSGRGAEIAGRVRKAALYVGSLIARPEVTPAELEARHERVDVGFGVARRLALCSGAEDPNHWLGDDLLREDDGGELYEATGVLGRCGNRLCPACSAHLRARTRRRVRQVLSQIRRLPGEDWRFLTLTAPNDPALGLVAGIQLWLEAWTAFSQLHWWRERAAGAVKGVEFTVDPDEPNSRNIHIHLLVLGPAYFELPPLRREWTQAVRFAYRQAGATMPAVNVDEWVIRARRGKKIARRFIELPSRNEADALYLAELHWPAADGWHSHEAFGLCICDAKFVRGRHDGGDGSKGVEGAINEVSKYITKTESWDDIPPGDLLEVATVARWPRMFELLGVCRSVNNATEPPKAVSVAPEAPPALLDTQFLSSPDAPELEDLNSIRGPPRELKTWRVRLLEASRNQRRGLKPEHEFHSLAEWNSWQTAKWKNQQTLRMIQLVTKYPTARFQLLGGEEFSWETYRLRPDASRYKRNDVAWRLCPVCRSHGLTRFDDCQACGIHIRFVDFDLWGGAYGQAEGGGAV